MEGYDDLLARYGAEHAPPEEDDREPLRIIAAPDLYATPTPFVEELVGPMVVRGKRTLIGGSTGDGKSTLVMHMVRAALLGTDFLGHAGRGDDTRALIVDVEQDVHDLKRLLEETGLEACDRLHYVHRPQGLALDRDDREATELEAIIAEGGYHLIVLDPLYKLWEGDSNSEQEVLQIVKMFDRWRTAYGFALVIPMHTRKLPVGASFTIHEIFGSSTWPRGAEIALGLQFREFGKSRLHVWKMRSTDALKRGTFVELNYVRGEGYTVGANTRDQTEETLVGFLRDRGRQGASRAELEEAGACSNDTVRRVMQRMGAEVFTPPGKQMKHYRLAEFKDDELLAEYERKASMNGDAPNAEDPGDETPGSWRSF